MRDRRYSIFLLSIFHIVKALTKETSTILTRESAEIYHLNVPRKAAGIIADLHVLRAFFCFLYLNKVMQS